jgi:hypothetical protein
MVSGESSSAARRKVARPNPRHESVYRGHCRGLGAPADTCYSFRDRGCIPCAGALAGTNTATYSPCMRLILLLLCVIILAFFGVVYAGCRSWRKMSAGKRIAGVFLLSPHFVFIVCIVVSLLCGHPPQGSQCFNTQFVCGVLIVFFLPLPALAGTITALVIFKRARMPL